MKMPDDAIIDQLAIVLETIAETRDDIQQEHQRFNVALTGGLRLLLESNKSTLAALHGSPENLVGYLLKMAEETHSNMMKRHESLRLQLVEILEHARNA